MSSSTTAHPIVRRPAVASALLGALALWLAPALTHDLRADEAPDVRLFTTEEVDDACQAAVAFLLSHQHEPGFFMEENRRRRDDWFESDGRIRAPRHSAAMTALTIMALSSVGHQPTDPTPEGEALARALDFMVREELQTDDGYYGQRDGSRMYGHGIISLMLAEMVGMGATVEQDQLLRDRTQRAIDLILRSQRIDKGDSHRGGWRYEPHSRDSDISVTVWQLMALRAASNAGFEVPRRAIDEAIEYVQRSYRSDRDEQGRPTQLDRPFSYQAHGGDQQFSTTAAGILSLQVAGAYDVPEVLGGANYLLENPPNPRHRWFFYGCYYYAQGMYQKGGEFAAIARQHTEETLLDLQDNDGSWRAREGSEQNEGRIYATSLALLSLSVRHHFLPIYQR